MQRATVQQQIKNNIPHTALYTPPIHLKFVVIIKINPQSSPPVDLCHRIYHFHPFISSISSSSHPSLSKCVIRYTSIPVCKRWEKRPISLYIYFSLLLLSPDDLFFCTPLQLLLFFRLTMLGHCNYFTHQ